MVTAISDEMFSGEAITDPYSYYGRIRDEDPVHWNEKYELDRKSTRLNSSHKPISYAVSCLKKKNSP